MNIGDDRKFALATSLALHPINLQGGLFMFDLVRLAIPL
jgi:hypothetical protein